MIEETLIRAVCAAVAAMGFGAVSNPSRRSFPVIAVLAASGYALRYVLMQGGGLDIATATLLASMLIGFGSLWLGKMIHSPMTTLYIPALLPMVPGMYAYKAVFSIILFMQNLGESSLASVYLNDFFLNVIVTVTVKENPRSLSAEELAAAVKPYNNNVCAAESYEQAIKMIGNEPCVVYGSLYLASAIRPLLFDA